MYPPVNTRPIQPMMPTHDPSIRLDEDGVVFNREAVKLLGITDASRINVVEEIGNPSYMYVQVVKTGGYVMHRKNKRLVVHSGSLARGILFNAKCKSKRAIYRLGEPTHNIAGERIVPIITTINYVDRN